MAGIHTENPATPEGKYLVIRRDGTIPQWPHFVLGGRDKSAATALRSYSRAVAAEGLDKEYADGVERLAGRFTDYNLEHGSGQADAGSNVTDHPVVVKMMRFKLSLLDIISLAKDAVTLCRHLVEWYDAQPPGSIIDGKFPVIISIARKIVIVADHLNLFQK